MKKLLLALGLAAIACAVSAQDYASINLVGTNTAATTGCIIAGSTATNINAWIDLRLQKSLSFSFSFQGDAAGTATQTAVFAPSVDGVNADTSKTFTLAVAQNGTTAVCVTTNWPDSFIGGYPWMKLLYLTNAAGSGNVTNTAVRWAPKRSAR